MRQFAGLLAAMILGAGMSLSSGPALAEDVTEVGFTKRVHSAIEGQSIRFVVKKTGSGEALVDYKFGHANVNLDQNATRGKDFLGVDGELYFGPDDTEKTITVQTRPDNEFDEEAETFSITLSIATGGDAGSLRLGRYRAAVGAILNCAAAC
ncbi:MAG: hypothetical protein F4Y62_17475 [Rhodospirillaceae bacterium]|nr:hypothetical protein [Gemmatimonadota bacterium]MXY41578.1 hypothetical protein [Rhodospirillaceae bacterium]MYF85204.1 hypothetical protein [Rhodospirillaceae bacterium]MYK13874.1 hypothetical protein [Rhodospirillaceae bacterium]